MQKTNNILCVTIKKTSNIIFVLLLLTLCRSPIGPLNPEKSLRKTPAGVLEQLITSYEDKRIDLYIDLFPKAGTFRFYVSPQFYKTFESRPYFVSGQVEPRDTTLRYIQPITYYYWTQDIEIRSHKSMFSNCHSIEFIMHPILDTNKIIYTLNKNGDTTNAELLLLDGQLRVSMVDSINENSSILYDYTVIIEKQVLYLERDNLNLWVIRKWYDFGTEN